MNYYSKETENSTFRIVMHRPGDNKSFLEANQRDDRENRSKFNYVLVELSDKDLIELKDYLNTVL